MINGDGQERRLSNREQEQMQVIADKVKLARDAVDDMYPEVVAAAALAKDCWDALKKEGIPDQYAIGLVGPVMNYLKGN